ncbi:hypothetical protein FBU30_002952 [Linnemannia zychae]|nr:hypothetical protein FBU30_002952 [Linnemannia zychae]
MSAPANSTPVSGIYTHQGVADLINDPNTKYADLVNHIGILNAQASQANIENAELHTQIEAQAHALQDTINGPLLSISATLQAIVAVQ